MTKELRREDNKILSLLQENGKMLSADMARLLGMEQKNLVQQLISLARRGYLGTEMFDDKHNTRLWYALAEQGDAVPQRRRHKTKNTPDSPDTHDEWYNSLTVKKVKFNPWGQS